MRPWRALQAHRLSLVTIVIFSGLLVFALWRLLDTEEILRNETGDNMLWAISQAQLATQQLDITLGRARLGEVDPGTLELRHDVLLSRLSLLGAGPQQRYLRELGRFEPLWELAEEVYAQEAAVLAFDADDIDALHDLLARLAGELGRTANSAMVAQWERTGAQLDRQHAAIIQVIATVIVILALGTFISWRMLAAQRAQQRTQMSLLREQEIREAYRSFVALVSHQFRTPLAVIDSSMQRILRKGAAMSHGEIRERAQRVRERVKNLTTLMQATLDSMRLDSGEVLARPTECDLAAELNEARARQLEANPRRRIQIEIGEEVPARFTSDPLLLQQILANLLANAISYSPESELVILRARAASGRLRISVIDHGIGIPEQEQEMLFQPYFRASTTRQVRGIGIGLHLSQSLASILGGSLSCESTQGIGSTFTLDLPL